MKARITILGAAFVALGATAAPGAVEEIAPAAIPAVVTEYGTQTGEYEEVFSVDRCIGDHVLEAILESTRAIGAGG